MMIHWIEGTSDGVTLRYGKHVLRVTFAREAARRGCEVDIKATGDGFNIVPMLPRHDAEMTKEITVSRGGSMAYIAGSYPEIKHKGRRYSNALRIAIDATMDWKIEWDGQAEPPPAKNRR